MSYILSQLPGGLLAFLTILLALMFLCAWKAPRWVRPIGSIALAITAIHILFGIMEAFYDMHLGYGISPTVMAAGLKVTTILVEYSLLIYFISHVISFIQKPNR